MPIKDPDRRREYQRENMRRWRAANPERNREAVRRADAKRDPEKNKAQCRSWYQRHADAINARRRAEYAADPEPILVANRESYARHRENRVAYARAYRKRNGGA